MMAEKCRPGLITRKGGYRPDTSGSRVSGLGSSQGQGLNRGSFSITFNSDCDDGTLRGFPVLLVGISHARRSPSTFSHPGVQQLAHATPRGEQEIDDEGHAHDLRLCSRRAGLIRRRGPAGIIGDVGRARA
jgi:hypothetical protein